jgi:hypothetical protein
MADPVTMGLMLGGMGVKALGSFFGGRALKNAQKEAGTQLYQGANREAANALLMPETINPAISEAYQRAQGYVGDVYNRSGDDLIGAGRTANEYLNPYIDAGSRSLTTLTDLANAPQAQFDPSNLTMDPGYAFRMAEGQKALERSAASRGILQTGGTLKALTRYGQDAASQEYQSAFNRALSTFGANQSARQQQLGTLSGLVNTGYGASQGAGNNLIGTQQTAGNWRNTAAQLQGGYGIDSANRQADVSMRYGDMARDLRLQGVQAQADSILGRGQATASQWGGASQAIGGGLTLAGMMRQGGGSTPGQYNNLPTVGAGGGYNYPQRPYGW